MTASEGDNEKKEVEMEGGVGEQGWCCCDGQQAEMGLK